jgi:hypothetical protein
MHQHGCASMLLGADGLSFLAYYLGVIAFVGATLDCMFATSLH